MFFRQLLNDETAWVWYVLGCKTHSAFAVVEPHVDLVDEYLALAEAQGRHLTNPGFVLDELHPRPNQVLNPGVHP